MRLHTALLAGSLAGLGGAGYAQTIDHSAGFAAHGDLAANGDTAFVGGGARLTDMGTVMGTVGATSSLYSAVPVNVTRFTSAFTFQILNGRDNGSDGFTFVVQNDGPAALGGGGGFLGYGARSDAGNPGVTNSVALKFDLHQNTLDGRTDPSNSSTGLFTDAQAPSGGVDLLPSGINLHSQDPFAVNLDYGNGLLNVTISDLTTNAAASQSYAVDIPATVGGSTAYVGFTGATGLGTATQDIQTWTFASASVPESSDLALAGGRPEQPPFPLRRLRLASLPGRALCLVGRDVRLVLQRHPDVVQAVQQPVPAKRVHVKVRRQALLVRDSLAL